MKVVVFVLVLAACDQGRKESPAPPAPPPPMGIIKGRVTATLNGPGRAHAPSESSSHTSGIECTVLVIDRSGNPIETSSRADGVFEVSVPVGHYDVSFNECRGDRSCAVTPPMPIDVAVGSAATADWDCEMNAK